MKSTELRIGNYIYDDFNEIHRVESIQSESFNKYNGSEDTKIIFSKIDGTIGFYQCDEVTPIPLTEKWMLKFGFEKYDWVNGYFIKCNGKYLFIQFYESDNTHQILVFFTKVSKDSRGHKMNGRDYFVPKNSVKHVHQLQNLFYSLTGTELELTPYPITLTRTIPKESF